MDPISLSIMAVGLGMSVFGGAGSMFGSKRGAEISADEARAERDINEKKQEQMELSARRQQMETVRNQQRARAMAVQSATTQGAQFGSGLQGGLAQIDDASANSLLNINQGLQIGRDINTLNGRISADKIQQSYNQSNMATSQGIQSLGGTLMKLGPTIGNLSQGFGGGNIGTFSDGGNNGMAPTWS